MLGDGGSGSRVDEDGSASEGSANRTYRPDVGSKRGRRDDSKNGVVMSLRREGCGGRPWARFFDLLSLRHGLGTQGRC